MANFDISRVRLEHLPEGVCRDLAEQIGIENLLVVADMLGGSEVYIPSKKNLLKVLRNELIAMEFDCGNYVQLARKYDISETWVRTIVKENKGGG